MNPFSFLKAAVLPLLDRKPFPFTRAVVRDPIYPTLDEIASASEDELQNFVKDGLYISQKPNDLGDACIWQGVYTAMCVHRWKVQKSPWAHDRMVEAGKALAIFVKAGVLYRGVMPTSLNGTMFHKDPSKTYFDDPDGFTYRDDASLDSLLGFCFGASALMSSLDLEARESIWGAVRSLSSWFSAKGYRLINRDGSFTKYGNCAPGPFQAPVRTIAACLPSLICGYSDWLAIAANHADEFAVPDTQIPGKMSWVNAHLSMLAILTYVDMTTEKDPGHREAFRGLHTLLDKYSETGNAFLIFGSLAARVPVTYEERKIGEIILSEFSQGRKPHNKKAPNNLQPTPAHLRPRSDILWQRSPYEQGETFDENEDHIEYNRLDFLIAYYMMRGIK